MSRAIDKKEVSRIGRYEIVGHLAYGGMAEILLARVPGERGFARAVVVKHILPNLARSKDFEAMFLDEARLAASIHHPNVVQVFDLGREDEELFLVMEYLEGESAAGLLRRAALLDEKLDPQLAAYIVAEIAAGLHAAHESKDAEGNSQHLVHRDVSPHNIIIGYDGSVKLIDFGIAKAIDQVGRTEAGQIKGKLGYLSPEQCRGKSLDRRSDIFSLGIVLYELGTGRRLFGRANAMSTFDAICKDPIAPPSSLRPELSACFDDVTLAALHRDRSQRLQTAAEMRRRLQECFVGPPPSEQLATLMQRIFVDRVEEKAELMRRVRNGSAITNVPMAETDLGFEIPTVVETRAEGIPAREDGSRMIVTDGRSARGRKGRWLLGGLGVAAIGALVATKALRKEPDAVRTEPTSFVDAGSSTLPVADASRSSELDANVDVIVLAIATEPAGATIRLHGVDIGTTPKDVELPRGTDAVRLEIHREGHASRVENVVPDRDQRLVLSLRPASSSRPRATPPASGRTVPAPSSSKGYYQF